MKSIENCIRLFVVYCSVFLHRDERLNVTTTNGTRVFGSNQLLTTLMTDTEMSARHDKSILSLSETYRALNLCIVSLITNRLLTLRTGLTVSVLLYHTIDRLDLEG